MRIAAYRLHQFPGMEGNLGARRLVEAGLAHELKRQISLIGEDLAANSSACRFGIPHGASSPRWCGHLISYREQAPHPTLVQLPEKRHKMRHEESQKDY
jgi:hypothetical protein